VKFRSDPEGKELNPLACLFGRRFHFFESSADYFPLQNPRAAAVSSIASRNQLNPLIKVQKDPARYIGCSFSQEWRD
jgi:hypothetical protein